MQGYLVLLFIALVVGCSRSSSWDTESNYSPIHTPEEEQASFALVPGMRIDLVASEPLVEDPVFITFDEDGRLWVVEMRGFMPDVEGRHEEAPVGRISVLHDLDGDGVMDRRSTFLDSLVLPRALAIVEGGALIAENKPLWFVEDVDGDLKADSKTLIDPEYGGSGLPEHSGNGLWRGLDNWYYNAKSQFRYRRTQEGWIRDETEFRGQWGISHDDKGRLYYNYNWSQLHADLVPPNALSRNAHHTPTSGIDVGLTTDLRIYPIRPNPAVNRGYIPGSLDENGRLLEFTSASSPLVYRGTALSEEFYGNVFVCEPAGNLIKRNLVDERDFSLTSRFAYPDFEFLASTDERFRPVSLATGPDGALYVVDMYRGIIQHGAYMTPYLREQTLARGLERPLHYGRIWRIVSDDWQAPPPIHLSRASTDTLVELLSDPNGWVRDTAQRLLVEREDPASLSLLRQRAVDGIHPLGRLHALWTLEGLHAPGTDTFFEALGDSSPTVQAAAIRILEQRASQHPSTGIRLEQAVSKSWQNASWEVVLAMALSAGRFPSDKALPVLEAIITAYYDRAVMRDAVLSSLENEEFSFLRRLWDAPDWAVHHPEKSIFIENLTLAIAKKGDPTELEQVLSVLHSEPAETDWRAEALLNGMALFAKMPGRVPLRLSESPEIFDDLSSWSRRRQIQLAEIESVFEWPGRRLDRAPEENNPVWDDQTQSLYVLGRTKYLAVCAGCHGSDGEGLRRFAPPLVRSEWVLGSEEHLVRILLHGMEGPLSVDGIRYASPDILPVMPSHSALNDRELAAILTYIRKDWGHRAETIVPGTVGRIRHGSQGRVYPWTADELQEATFD